MKEELQKEIDQVKANLEVLPKKTKIQKNKYNEYLQIQIDKMKPKLEEIDKEILSRVDKIIKTNTKDKLPEEISALDIQRVKHLSTKADSSEKMNLNYYFYELSHFQNDNLDKINEVILKLIEIFASVGVTITPKDFEYSESVSKYIETLLTKPEETKDLFDKLYWENDNLITQIELNFRALYFKNLKKIDKYYQNLTKNQRLSDYLNEYQEKEAKIINQKHNNKTYIFNKFINHELILADYSDKTIEGIMNELLLNKEDKSNYNNLIKLSISLSELKEYGEFDYIIKDIKEQYAHKDEYKGKYDAKLKEISKAEGNLYKLTKQINKTGMFKPNDKKVTEMRLKRNILLNDILSMYIELDELTIHEAILKHVTNETTYIELLKIVGFNFRYFVKLLEDQIDNLNISLIKQNIDKLYKFIYGLEINVLSNTAIAEEKDLTQIIVDKYRLMSITVKSDSLSKDEIDKTIKTVNDLLTYYDMKRININYDEIDFIFKNEKLKR